MTDRAKKAKEAIRLLRAVRNAVERVPLNGDTFDMSLYAYEHECGLAACAGGWAALDPYARRSFGLPPLGSVPKRFWIANDDGMRIALQVRAALCAVVADMNICGVDGNIRNIREKLGMKPLKHEKKVFRRSWIATADKLIEYLEKLQ